MASEGFVSVHALSAGYLTLPEEAFVTPLDDPSARKTVPSLSFLIQHSNPATSRRTRIVFDLGIRRRLADYAEPIYKHAMTRKPLGGDPDTVASLAAGGLTPNDIDIVAFSHLHWDHIGTPQDYPRSTFVIGPGAAHLIDGSETTGLGSHNHFEKGILDMARVVELPATTNNGLPATPPPDVEDRRSLRPETQALGRCLSAKSWQRIGLFDAAMDVFDDGSLYIVSAPGHLDGHINLLCRLAGGRYVYLAGDACHDMRLLTGEKEVATWTDAATGRICCIHKDKAAAEKTLSTIRDTMNGKAPELGNVEVIFAHDVVWEAKAKREGQFFPGEL